MGWIYLGGGREVGDDGGGGDRVRVASASLFSPLLFFFLVFRHMYYDRLVEKLTPFNHAFFPH